MREVEGGVVVQREVNESELPPVMPWPVFNSPGILAGKNPVSEIEMIRLSIANISDKTLDKQVGRERAFTIDLNFYNFMRLLAKIAHGYLRAEQKLIEWHPILNHAVLTGRNLPFYVGMYPRKKPPEWLREEVAAERSVEVSLQSLVWFEERSPLVDFTCRYLSSCIQLLPELGGAIYEIVVARLKRDGYRLLGSGIPLALPGDPTTERALPATRIWINVGPADGRPAKLLDPHPS